LCKMEIGFAVGRIFVRQFLLAGEAWA